MNTLIAQDINTATSPTLLIEDSPLTESSVDTTPDPNVSEPGQRNSAALQYCGCLQALLPKL
ncbi:MAG: hypothetical protein RJQ10_00190 [Haliea sp.]|uniref:hypothetical protein n=1 Tax=Haliea sp. TaxID=1932666 RepID=UPI0032EB3B3B